MLAMLMAGLPLLAQAENPKKAVQAVVETYIENYHQNNFEAMTAVLHKDFINRGITRDGQVTATSTAQQMQTFMQGQDALAPAQQKNLIKTVEVNGNLAKVTLETGNSKERWVEYIQLVKEDGEWKVIEVFWDFTLTA